MAGPRGGTFTVRGVAVSDALVLDGVGLALVGGLAAWVEFGAGRGAGRAVPVLALLAALVAVVVAGRVLSVVAPGLSTWVVAIAIAGSFAVTWPGALGAGGAPTGYGNANAALAGLGALAALQCARVAVGNHGRRGGLVMAGGFVLVAVATDSLAGVTTLAVVSALVALSALARWPGFAVVGMLVVLVVVLALTAAVGRGGDPLGLATRDETRTELWRMAVDRVDDDPWVGLGPGEFSDRSPSPDSDLRWAHHEYLQVAAELGVVGLGLVLALIGWAWARLWASAARSPATAATTAAVLGVITIHATVDWIWHVPVLVLIAGGLFGSGTGSAPVPLTARGDYGESLDPLRDETR